MVNRSAAGSLCKIWGKMKMVSLQGPCVCVLAEAGIVRVAFLTVLGKNNTNINNKNPFIINNE